MSSGATSGTTASPSEGSDIALIVGIPCGLIIVLLVFMIVIMICLIGRTNSNSSEQVEAMYIRRRFQGLSLEEQSKRRRKRRTKSKRQSVGTELSRSSSRASASGRRPGTPGNPFGLQEWQVRIAAEYGADPDTEETELEGEELERSAMGAINPILVVQESEEYGYDAPTGGGSGKPRGSLRGPASSNTSSDSSLNPYD